MTETFHLLTVTLEYTCLFNVWPLMKLVDAAKPLRLWAQEPK